MKRNIDQVLHHYLICALWSSSDDHGEPLDDYGIDDISPESIKDSRLDIEDFLKVTAGIDSSSWSDEQFGHDFWLTRCGHGAGFWDRGHGHVGEELSKWARVAGSVDLYVGDDGRVYIC